MADRVGHHVCEDGTCIILRGGLNQLLSFKGQSCHENYSLMFFGTGDEKSRLRYSPAYLWPIINGSKNLSSRSDDLDALIIL